MVYRRRYTPKKKTYRRKKRIMKKRIMRKKYRPTIGYTGQVNVSAELTNKVLQRGGFTNGEQGARLVVPWGAPATALSGYAGDQQCAFIDTAEWNLYKDVYEQYRIVGVRIMVTPGEHVGASTDARMAGKIHVGSATEVIANDNDVTVRRLQLSADYGSYRGNAQNGGFKRYYKVGKRQRQRFEQQWISTGTTDYSNAITYINWQVLDVDTELLPLGTWTVKWYLQFRNPKLSNVAA